MARIKAHQIVPALVIAAGTAIPAAATVEFLNQSPSAAGVGGVALSSPSTSSTSSSSGTSTPAAPSPTGPSTGKIASIHLPAGLSSDGGGDGGGGDDGGGGRPPRLRATSSQPVPTPPIVPASKSTTTHGSALNGNFTGAAVNDPFGTVQAKITVAGGKITSISASAPMNSQLSAAINQQAVPILRNETLQAQSANVNLVSGATLTSQAYIQSLQSALTQAHL